MAQLLSLVLEEALVASQRPYYRHSDMKSTQSQVENPEHARLEALSAAEILNRTDFARDPKPLESTRFAGAIDTVGGQVLATLVIPQIMYNGVIAATGNAGGFQFSTTVFPFILRNIRLQKVLILFMHHLKPGIAPGNYCRRMSPRISWRQVLAQSA